MTFSPPGNVFILSFDGHWICDYFQWVYFVGRNVFHSFNANRCGNFNPTMSELLLFTKNRNEIHFYEWSKDLFIIYYLWSGFFLIELLFIRIRCHVIALSYSPIPYTHCPIYLIEYIASECNTHKSSLQNDGKLIWNA